jgi:hypothetical protein
MLPAAQALQTLAGLTLRPTETLSLDVTAFYVATRDLAMRSAASTPLLGHALESSGEGRQYGAQAMLRQQLAEGFSGWVAYTLSRSERLDRIGSPWRLSDFDQTHVLSAVLAYRIPIAELDVSVRFRYATGMPRSEVIGASYDAATDAWSPRFGPHNAIRIPDFVQMDARVGRHFEIGDVRLDVSLEVLNVWNQTNAEEIVYAPDYSQRDYVRGLPILPMLGLRGEL